jgi:hypothetical protein
MAELSVIVYGPAGCGKTRNAEIIRDYFGLDVILDGWEPSDGCPTHGALILTNDYWEGLYTIIPRKYYKDLIEEMECVRENSLC